MALTEEKFKELMGLMLDKQNRDIEEKLGERLEGLKKEVSATMKTVTDRQDKLETDQIGMKENICELRTQMNEVKSIVESSVQNQGELVHKQQDHQHPQQFQQQGHRTYAYVAGTAAQPSLPEYLPRD